MRKQNNVARKFRWGILGTGGMAKKFVEALDLLQKSFMVKYGILQFLISAIA